MIKEIYKYQFPVFKIEAIITVFTIFVALVLANAIWETTVQLLFCSNATKKQLPMQTNIRSRLVDHCKF